MKFPRRRFLHLATGAAALPAVSRIASAQTYPSRPIRLVVPFPPGGAFDAVARPWVDKMKPPLGTMIVENIGGGGSFIRCCRGRPRSPGRLHRSPGRHPPTCQRSAAQEPAALRSGQGPGSDCGRGRRGFGACSPSISAGANAQRVRRLCQGQSRQVILRARRCWLGEPADRRDVQIARRLARARTGALSRCGTDDGGPDQRTGRDGGGGHHRAVDRTAPGGQAADSRRDEPGAPHRRAPSFRRRRMRVSPA